MKEKFEIATVLSITHECLLTDISSVYKVLNFMTGDKLFTHQLPRARDFVRPFLFHQHPNLDGWTFDGAINKDNYRQYVEMAVAMFGPELELQEVSALWTEKDAMQEAVEMFGEDKVIGIEVKP